MKHIVTRQVARGHGIFVASHHSFKAMQLDFEKFNHLHARNLKLINFYFVCLFIPNLCLLPFNSISLNYQFSFSFY